MKKDYLIWGGLIVLIIALYLSRKPVIKLAKKIIPMTRQDFIHTYTPVVRAASKGTGLFPSVFMAQAILESSDSKGVPGNSGLSKEHNNFFGIKKFLNDGHPSNMVVNKLTREVLNGKEKVISQPFRKYSKPEDSFFDRVKFLIKNKNYKKAGVFTATSPAAQAEALQRAGYATDPHYAKLLISLINKHNLTILDS